MKLLPSSIAVSTFALLGRLEFCSGASAVTLRGATVLSQSVEEQQTIPETPNPAVVWVNKAKIVPALEPKEPEQCFGCQCMVAFPGSWLTEGTFADSYTCLNETSVPMIPDFRWAGPKDGEKCRSCQSFAITMEDLDYPNGMGAPDNRIKNIFWAANIPGDWRSFNAESVTGADEAAMSIVVGRNGKGKNGLDAPCPSTGVHRYHITMWSLDSQLDDISSDFGYHDLKKDLELHELARKTFYAQVSAARFISLRQNGEANVEMS